MAELHHEAYQKSVQDIVNLYKNGQLNLSPGFQRDSVWTLKDRVKLIDSIVRNYPLPSIFLYRRQEDGEIIHDVIDGKQRLESILMFIGLKRGERFEAKVQLPGEEEKDWVDWRALVKKHKQHLITGYSLRIIDVDGEISDIIDLFVRINSTGKALSPAEKRHAKYYTSIFLREAGKLAIRNEDYLHKAKILSAGQITRMKHVELMCELMISIHQKDVLNKKTALNSVLDKERFSDFETKKAVAETVKAINRVRHMFPKLGETRFSKVSDYYSLVVLISKLEAEGAILTDRNRNGLAWDLLRAFSTGVDEVRERQKKALGPKPGQESYRDYLLTVLQATDEISQRRNREIILRGLLQNLFKKRDTERLFSQEQRRIMWNSSAERKCAKCKKPVRWNDLTLDHIQPHSKGGRARLENATLMHRKCNSSEGNRKGSY